MPRVFSYRKHRRSKSDYTKDPSIRWFIYALVLIAAYLIIQTLAKDRVKETEVDPQNREVVKQTQAEKPDVHQNF